MPAVGTLAVFALAAVALILLPGPAMLFLIARGIGHGRRVAMVSAVGVDSATAVFVVCAAVGLTALLASSAIAFTVVRVVGAAYLGYLGIKALRGNGPALGAPTPTAGSARRAFRQGFLVGITNPKVALFFLAFLPQFVDPARGSAATQILLLGAIFTLIGLTFDLGYAAAAGTLGGWLRRRPRLAKRQRYVTGTLYLALGASAAIGGTQQA
jgi:threonine/homoserine/homoserine lactone efflux protein